MYIELFSLANLSDQVTEVEAFMGESEFWSAVGWELDLKGFLL